MPARARDLRWRTRFGRFVAQYGAGALARALTEAGAPVSRNAVHEWLAARATPRIGVIAALARLSRGRVTLGVVVAHAETLRRAHAAPEPEARAIAAPDALPNGPPNSPDSRALPDARLQPR